MKQTRRFVYLQRVFVLITWAVVLTLFLLRLTWIPLSVLAAMHLIEIPLAGVPRGGKAGFTVLHSGVMTLLFGFTWWLYLDSSDGADTW